MVVVGVSLGTLAPAVSWLRRIAGHWWRERPGTGRSSTSVRRWPATPTRSGRSATCATDHRHRGRLTSAAWEDVTGHRHQVLVCRGPRCTAPGSDLTAEALIIELMRQGQGDDDVLITHTGCQFPCNQAPVVSVQPDDVWYGGVDPEAARADRAEHLVGRPLGGGPPTGPGPRTTEPD